MERVDHLATAAGVDADQEVHGKVEADRRPALRSGGVEIEDAERDRQAAAAADDADQVGVLGIVVGFAVAAIVEALAEGPRQRSRRRVARFARLRGRRRQLGEMGDVGIERHVGMVERGQGERSRRQLQEVRRACPPAA